MQRSTRFTIRGQRSKNSKRDNKKNPNITITDAVQGNTKTAAEARKMLLEKVISSSPLAVIALDRDETVQIWNSAAENMFGWRADEVIGQYIPFIAPERKDEHEYLNNLARQGENIVLERTKRMRKDGTLIDVSLSVSPLKDNDGNYLGRVGIIADITEHVRTEERLRESEDKFFKAFHKSPAAMSMATFCEGVIVDANEEFIRLSGHSRDKLIGHTTVELGLWADSMQRKTAIEILRKRESVKGMPVSLVTKSGRIRDLVWSADVVKINQIKCLLTSAIDITERNRAEKEMLFQKEFLQKIIDNAPVMISHKASDISFKWVNKEWERTLGWSLQDAQDKDFMKNICPDHFVRAVDFMKTAKNKWGDFRAFRRDGTLVETSWKNIRLSDDTILSFGIDTTELKEKERALEESREYLAQILNSISDPIYVVDSHGWIVLVNDAGCEVTGLARDRLLGKTAYEYFKIGKVADFRKTDDLILKAGRESVTEEAVLNVQGEERIYDVRKTVYEDREGDKQIVGVFRDITEQKNSAKALEKSEKTLMAKSKNLEELNAALRILLKHREEDKKELESKIVYNFKKLVLPYLEKLKSASLKEEQRSYLKILESNLTEIMSPFLRDLIIRHTDLTPREVQIIDLIKEGMTSKEIAKILNISAKAVDFHRGNIRRKFRLPENSNLRTYLSKIS